MLVSQHVIVSLSATFTDWIRCLLYATELEEEKERVKNGLHKINISKLTRPIMLDRIVQHRIYNSWDMIEHHRIAMDPKKYNKESNYMWYDPKEIN